MDQEQLYYLEKLAKLKLTDEERTEAAAELEELLTYFQRMQQVDTREAQIPSQGFGLSNVFREDEVTSQSDLDLVLQNAPAERDGYFVVPRTFGEN